MKIGEHTKKWETRKMIPYIDLREDGLLKENKFNDLLHDTLIIEKSFLEKVVVNMDQMRDLIKTWKFIDQSYRIGAVPKYVVYDSDFQLIIIERRDK